MKKKPEISIESEKKMKDFTISPPENLNKRILGSHSSMENFKRIDDDGFPGDFPDGGYFPPPPPPVSSPDLALQFKPSLEEIEEEFNVLQLKDKIISAIKTAYGANADVRYSGSNNVGRIGIWFRPSVSNSDNQARDRGLQAINILKESENFAIFINASYVKVEANRAWQQMPKVLNKDMKPDNGGPIHLTSLSVTFQSPNTIITRLSGFDERPWPDVDFVFTIKDVFNVSSTEITVATNNGLDVDTSWLNWLTGIFLLVFPPLGLVFLVQNIIVRVNEGEQENDEGGVGKRIASTLPKEIMIEGGQKIIFLYNRIDISSGGIFGGGIAFAADRSPSLEIRGSFNLTSDSRSTSITKKYYAITEDLRGNLQYKWKVSGAVISENSKSPNIIFNFDRIPPGQVITKKLYLTVTDADGMSITVEKDVKIYSSLDDLGGLPPICRTKPYLPQCQPK